MWLLGIAAFGLLVPNGLFLYWLVNEFRSLEQVLSDRLALGFILDLFVATALLTYLVAAKPLGRIKWPWFLLLSLVGGLGFSIPLYLWLNWRNAPDPEPTSASGGAASNMALQRIRSRELKCPPSLI